MSENEEKKRHNIQVRLFGEQAILWEDLIKNGPYATDGDLLRDMLRGFKGKKEEPK